MPAEYSFVSRWSVPADADRVWRETVRLLTTPSGDGAPDLTGPGTTWWPGVRFEGAPASLEPGVILFLTVRSPLGYRLRVRLTVDDIEPGRTLATSSAGDLRGRGRLSVEPDGDAASVVVFLWDVVTERRWMNTWAWALRPAFEGAHAHVMRAGERGLREELAGRSG
ncbi:hypothetical protein MK786_01980 [Microbacterium sp. CFH 31415]|uniref:hypothetical protein n=1 Tax=Microbacterium sp. CFH 31415 TaxID=2921732 RepID=UPI001F12ACED|nr:hypothetical protein [Microbacterium sp. CFH 31415]MCH6229505.1 hypothetical protein [Microbacterium sp. CFH 31415]